MTVGQRVRRLLLSCAPEPLCDRCIARLLGVPWPGRINEKTRELATEAEFDRCVGLCAACGAAHRKVIRFADPLKGERQHAAADRV